VNTTNIEFTYCEEISQWGIMKKRIISVLIMYFPGLTLACCPTSRKNLSELKGLMLLDNKQHGRNSAYY